LRYIKGVVGSEHVLYNAGQLYVMPSVWQYGFSLYYNCSHCVLLQSWSDYTARGVGGLELVLYNLGEW